MPHRHSFTSHDSADVESRKRVDDLTFQMRQLIDEQEDRSEGSDDNTPAEEFWSPGLLGKPDLINIDEAEKKILEKQLQQTVAELDKAKDDLHFAEHRLRESESRAKSLVTQLISERDRNQATNKQALTGAQKFIFQKTLMLQRRRLRKRHTSEISDLHEHIENQEQALMFSHDMLLNPLPEVLPSSPAEVPPSSLYDYMKESESFRENNAAFNQQQYIEAHKGVKAVAADEYADVKAGQSLFESELTKLKNDLRPILNEFKESTDNSFITIERILWPPVGRHPRPKEAFSKAAKTQMAKSKMLLADGYRRLNNAILSFVEEEKNAKQKWTRSYQDSISKSDSETQTDPSTEPTEEEIKLKTELEMVRDRMVKIREQSIKKERTIQSALDRVKLNLQYIQEKALELHKSTYTALHACFKHRFKWIDRHVDNLRDPALQKSLHSNKTDVKYNLSLGTIITKDIDQLKRFTEYFTRDDFFGLDMACKDAPIPGSTQSVPWKPGGRKNSRRKSSVSSLRAAGNEELTESHNGSPGPQRRLTVPLTEVSPKSVTKTEADGADEQNDDEAQPQLPVVPPAAPTGAHSSSPRKRRETEADPPVDPNKIRNGNRRRSAACIRQPEEELSHLAVSRTSSGKPSTSTGDLFCPEVTNIVKTEERRSSTVPRLELKGNAANRSISEHRQSPHPPESNNGSSSSLRVGRPMRSAGTGRARSQRHLRSVKSVPSMVTEPQSTEEVTKAIGSLLTYDVNGSSWCSPPRHSVVAQPDGTHVVSSR
eukprot:TRINITY_DN8928_c0_g1_i1.p1 TRINITY_DN8928_c0_g1~~TRINITY_DN8928_c0_g1_i1.p1  ORF type:complete len:771 (+),score=164.44 TRINITY_DN8928_c0_g1_i1:43-2355(+)